MSGNMNVSWDLIPYSQLSVSELHGLLMIRQAVFIVEQKSIYLDADAFDEYAHHLIVRHGGNLNSTASSVSVNTIIAYARLILPKLKTDDAVLGRILVAKDYRNQGLGRELVKRCLDECDVRCPSSMVKLSAQLHLRNFYTELGFQAVGNVYDDGGVEHIDMKFTE